MMKILVLLVMVTCGIVAVGVIGTAREVIGGDRTAITANTSLFNYFLWIYAAPVVVIILFYLLGRVVGGLAIQKIMHSDEERWSHVAAFLGYMVGLAIGAFLFPPPVS